MLLAKAFTAYYAAVRKKVRFIIVCTLALTRWRRSRLALAFDAWYEGVTQRNKTKATQDKAQTKQEGHAGDAQSLDMDIAVALAQERSTFSVL